MATRFGGVRLVTFNKTELVATYVKAVIYRFVLYGAYLRSIDLSMYRTVLHADSFDAYFQQDPFSSLGILTGLAFYAENTAIRLGGSRLDREWISGCRGNALLHHARTLPRICMGVVFGDMSSFLTFLSLVLPRLMLPWKCNDQGVVNILIWNGEFAKSVPVTVFSNLDGSTLHANTDWFFKYTNDGLIRDATNEPYAIIHQFDRFLRLKFNVLTEARPDILDTRPKELSEVCITYYYYY